MTLTCENCNCMFSGPKPAMCCDGQDCGCKGMPVNPVVCCDDCEEALAGNLSFFLYDGRYLADPDRASVYGACTSLKEALKEKAEEWEDCVIVKLRTKNNVIISKEIVE